METGKAYSGRPGASAGLPVDCSGAIGVLIKVGSNGVITGFTFPHPLRMSKPSTKIKYLLMIFSVRITLSMGLGW